MCPYALERFDPSGVSPPWARLARYLPETGIPACSGVLAGIEMAADSLRERGAFDEHERPVVTEANKTAVRAGSTGHNVRYVLIASCALVIIAFIAIALFVKP
jgi:hypothetical protein